MAIPTRRTSARLSGGSVNDDQDPPLAVELLDNLTRKKRNSANGTIMAGGSATEQSDVTDGTRKRQRTADKPVGKRKTKAAAFNPVALSSNEDPDAEITPDRRPPPPPPSVRRIARQQPPSRSLVEQRSPSPPAVPITSTTAGRPKKTAAKHTEHTEPIKVDKGKSAVKPVNGRIESTGMENPGSTALELENEKLLWAGLTNQPDAGSSSGQYGGLIDGIDFSTSDELMPTLARPLSPPRAAPNAFEFQTPRASRRTKLVTVDTIEPIALGETPNDRRKAEKKQRESKRASMSVRGRGSRMTNTPKELIEPHEEVRPEQFHLHIAPAPSLSQPLRARHLLLWCIRRGVKDEKKKPRKELPIPHTGKGDEIVGSIMDELLQALGNGDIDDNIWAKTTGDSTVSSTATLPHPRNKKNEEIQRSFQADIARDKAEDHEWQSIFARVNQHRTEVLDEQRQWRKRQEKPEEYLPDDFPSFTGREAGIDKLHAWAEMAQHVLEAGDDIEAMPLDDVEYHVDVLHQASHAALQYSATTKRFLDGIFASLAQDVRNRDQSGAPPTLADNGDRDAGAPPTVVGFLANMQAESSSQPSSGLDILKSLSADDDPSRGAEMMRLLESLPPVPPSVRRPANPTSMRAASSSTAASSSSMTPRRPGAGMGITPRKIGRLGSSTPRREREVSRGPSPSLAT